MNSFSLEQLKELVEQSQGVCVSIYMPTYKAGPETRQNPIRFKNLIREAEAKLQKLSITEPSTLLQPALDLDDDDWQNQEQGLAIFLAEGFSRFYRLPFNVDELVVVSEQFHLKPLMPLLTRDSEFYVLALSQKRVRFFEANRYSIDEVEIEGMPQSMDDALQYDETAKAGQFRISTSKGGTANVAQQAGSFHGQGSPDRDDIKQDILQYFHIIDHTLHDFLRDRRGPLVLIGVEYLLPIYREANNYAHLLDEGVTENPEILKPEELHAQVLPIVEPYFSQAEQAAIEHYQEMAATGKTSADPEETIPAAYFGRVEQLFVAVGVQKWGNFDPQAMELHIHPDPEPGDEDLLNAAAVQTLLNGGSVYAIEPEKVPDSAPLAAVFRY
jgi:Bacterial archaeo-eukaryotic release factor family 6